MTSSEDLRSRWILGAAAAFAMAWAIARAAIQSITIDEAVSYELFASRHLYLVYSANNHILNSTLMYGFTRVLGLSQFTARLPALIGAALYITAAYRFCRLLGTSLFVQLTVFVCLVFNPFIFDYLVAARGYGLALGFLLWAMLYAVEEGPTVAACAISSVCAGMSVNANFSFAFVNFAAMTAILSCAWYRRPNQWIRLLAACALPGAATVAIVSGYALTHTHPGELVYGAHSLSETFGTIIEASLFQSPLDFLGPLVFPLVGFTGVIWLSHSVKKIGSLGWVAAAIFAVTLAVHWTAFHLFGLLLPKDRTAIYFFPLFMIVAGLVAAIPSSSSRGRYPRSAFVGSLAIMAIYFLSCMRLTYFKEWKWDSDTKETYAVLSCLNREEQVTHVATTWEYRGPLNFYQEVQPTSMDEIDEPFDPQRTQVYVVDTFHTYEALEGKDLKIFYRSPVNPELVLAASPQLADTYAAGSCLRLYKK